MQLAHISGVIMFAVYISLHMSKVEPRFDCKLVQVINLNVPNSILKPSNQILITLFGLSLLIDIGISTKPYKR